MVLMPLLLLLAVNRWSANYDNLLITNVQSDLRIADQYLQRILTTTGDWSLIYRRASNIRGDGSLNPISRGGKSRGATSQR